MSRILTLDARDHIMLETMRDYFDLNAQLMYREIQGLHHETIEQLKQKGIKYDDLRSALVPRSDRYEAAFIFDISEIDSSWYGLEVFHMYFPILDRRSNHSILCGDLLGNDQQFIFEMLRDHLVLARRLRFKHSTLLYCIYLNNLTPSMINNLHQRMSSNSAYVGHIPTTYSSIAKTYLSTTLTHGYIKYRGIVLNGHEPDRDHSEDINMSGYPFDEYGYTIRSIGLEHFGLFLSYKIERAVFPGFEIDTEMSLNSVSTDIVDIRDCKVSLDQAKHEYLISAKAGKMQKAGLENLSRDAIAEMIREKVDASYIYNMEKLEEYEVVKFNVMLEVTRPDGGYPTRLTAALEYKPLEKVLRVISLH